MNSENGIFKTSDLGLAVFLSSLGAELTDIDRTDLRRAVFTFYLGPAQKDGIAKWQDGSALVNALAFWASYQRLKLELHNKVRR